MSQLTLQVVDNLSVNTISNLEYEFLMSAKDIAEGYCVSSVAIRKYIHEHSNERIDGQHWIKMRQLIMP